MKLGRYTLIRRIGAGGMAEVWKARFHGPDGFAKTVAIKKILPHLVLEGSFVEMFVAEAKLIAKLTHPNIVQLVDFARIEEDGSDRPEYFIAMEYVAGQHLGQILRRAAEKSIKISPEVGIYIVLEVAKALGYAHAEGAMLGNPRAVVHQDISPSNILVSYSGAVKVADFGIANVVRALIPQQEGRVTGKVGYMSPEQARAQKLDGRSDLFSLGIVLCELMTGRRLFSGKSAPEILQKIVKFDFPEEDLEKRGVPYEVREVLRHALTLDRVDRYQQASEIEAELSAILDRGSHIQARNVLAQLVQNLFPSEYDREVAEEMEDDEDIPEDDATTTRQMTNPAYEYDAPVGTQVVSELNIAAVSSGSPPSRSESISAGGGMSVSGEAVAEPEPTAHGNDTTRILERDGPGRSILRDDDPPTLEPGNDMRPVNVREDDPTILGPRPNFDDADGLDEDKPTKPTEPPQQLGPQSITANSNSVRPVSRGFPPDPPTAPVKPVSQELKAPPGAVVDFPDQKETVNPVKLALIAFVVMVVLAAALLAFKAVRDNQLASRTPTAVPTSTIPAASPTINEITLDTPTPEPTQVVVVDTPEPTPEPTAQRTPRRTPVSTPRRTPVQTPVRTPATPKPTPAAVQYGYLTVNARPWAETWVGGKRISREAVNKYKMPAGIHTIEFRNPVSKFQKRQRVRIYPGRVTSVFVDVPGNRVVVQTK